MTEGELKNEAKKKKYCDKCLQDKIKINEWFIEIKKSRNKIKIHIWYRIIWEKIEILNGKTNVRIENWLFSNVLFMSSSFCCFSVQRLILRLIYIQNIITMRIYISIYIYIYLDDEISRRILREFFFGPLNSPTQFKNANVIFIII